MLDISYVNNVGVVAKNPKMTAINSAIEVDLTGQVCSDSIGTRMYSGFGGQVDFIRGAAEGFDGKGKPIIALPAVTKRNESKIVPTLKPGMRDESYAGISFLTNSLVLQAPASLPVGLTSTTSSQNTESHIFSGNLFVSEPTPSSRSLIPTIGRS